MDKIFLSSKDVVALFEWRDKNIELVRRNICPIKAIQIILPESKLHIKYVREQDIISIHLVLEEQGKINFKVRCIYGLWKIISQPTRTFFEDKNVENEIYTDTMGMYFALMTLMAYGDEVTYTNKELEVIDDVIKKKRNENLPKSNKSIKENNIIYLLKRNTSGRLSITNKGHHNSPRGQFNVRGHFRHYKDGKVVWITEYKKGIGKKKDKKYKL